MNESRATLVVVDDEPGVLDSLRDQFRKEFLVHTFTSAPEALSALETIEPAVVLSDQKMPEMTGVNFLRRVKQRHPDATRLLFTGYADIKAVVDAINEGHVFRYVEKPWEADEMAGVIRQAVDHHNLLVERRRLIAQLQASNARLEESNSLKKAFIEVASHELNTPVAVILGMTDLWRLVPGGETTATQSAWLDRIQGAGRRLAATVERMLKLLRADQFDKALDLRETEIGPLIRQAVAGVQPFLDARGQAINVRLGPDLGVAEIDPAKVGDILTNLLVNAIKFTPDGGTIAIEADPIGLGEVRFRIRDTGVGIAAPEREHLFKPFFTGFDTMHHSSGEYQFRKKGMGLGLCLVKMFVEIHGGTVDYAADPDGGSTFAFTLPRRPRKGVDRPA